MNDMVIAIEMEQNGEQEILDKWFKEGIEELKKEGWTIIEDNERTFPLNHPLSKNWWKKIDFSFCTDKFLSYYHHGALIYYDPK